MTQQDHSFSDQNFWNQVLAAIDKKQDVLFTQLEEAQDKYPELTDALNLLIAYIGYLHHEWGSENGGSTNFYPLPQQFCRRNSLLCNCVYGNQSACKELGGHIIEIKQEQLDCEDLWSQYRAAKQRELEELLKALQSAGSSVVDELTLSLHLFQQKESDRIYQQLKDNGCIYPHRPRG